jgi:hypothetical protein
VIETKRNLRLSPFIKPAELQRDYAEDETVGESCPKSAT